MLQFLHTHWRDIGAILIALYLLWLIIYRPEDLFLAGRSWRSRFGMRRQWTRSLRQQAAVRSSQESDQ